MELQRGYCALCISNTKVVVPPQASTITNFLKSMLADQIYIKEFPSINSTLRVCPICLQNILTIKALSKKFQRHIAPNSENCSLCEENQHLVIMTDHIYMNLLLKGTKYGETVADCFMCLDCIKCLELMRSIRTNLLKKYPQLLRSSPNKSKDKSLIKSPTSSTKKDRRKIVHNTFLSHLKPASRTKYNLQHFRKDFTLLHKICYVKLNNADLQHLKKTYKSGVEEHRSRRKSDTPKKNYKRMMSPASEDNSQSQHFFKIKMKQQTTHRSTRHQDKQKSSPSVKKGSSIAEIPTPVRPKRKSISKEETLEVREQKKAKPSRVRSGGNYKESVDGKKPSRVKSRGNKEGSVDEKKLVVNVNRLSVDEENKDEDDEPLLVVEKDPLAISDDENLLKTPTKASRKMMPDSSGKKRKSVTFAEEKNVEIEYEKFEPKAPGETTPMKKSSLKKSKDNDESDEEVVEYLEHVRNNVDDVFNSLKSNESAKPKRKTIASTVYSDDEETSDQTELSAVELYKETPNKDDAISDENSSKKRKRTPSPLHEGAKENSENNEADHEVKKLKIVDADKPDISESTETHNLEGEASETQPESQEDTENNIEPESSSKENNETDTDSTEYDQENVDNFQNATVESDENMSEHDNSNVDFSQENTQGNNLCKITDSEKSGHYGNLTQADDSDDLLTNQTEKTVCDITESNINCESQDVIETENEMNIENDFVDLPVDEPEKSPCDITDSDINGDSQDINNAGDKNNTKNDDISRDQPENSPCEITENDINDTDWRSDYELKNNSGQIVPECLDTDIPTDVDKKENNDDLDSMPETIPEDENVGNENSESEKSTEIDSVMKYNGNQGQETAENSNVAGKE